jgi:hypothetical protein
MIVLSIVALIRLNLHTGFFGYYWINKHIVDENYHSMNEDKARLEIFAQTYVVALTMCFIYFIWNLFKHISIVRCFLKIIATNEIIFYLLTFSIFYGRGFYIMDFLFLFVYSHLFALIGAIIKSLDTL